MSKETSKKELKAYAEDAKRILELKAKLDEVKPIEKELEALQSKYKEMGQGIYGSIIVSVSERLSMKPFGEVSAIIQDEKIMEQISKVSQVKAVKVLEKA